MATVGLGLFFEDLPAGKQFKIIDAPADHPFTDDQLRIRDLIRRVGGLSSGWDGTNNRPDATGGREWPITDQSLCWG